MVPDTQEKNQTEMNNTISKTKTALEGFSSKSGETEGSISKLEHKVAEKANQNDNKKKEFEK